MSPGEIADIVAIVAAGGEAYIRPKRHLTEQQWGDALQFARDRAERAVGARLIVTVEGDRAALIGREHARV